jgi:hypothetical protein
VRLPETIMDEARKVEMPTEVWLLQ